MKISQQSPHLFPSPREPRSEGLDSGPKDQVDIQFHQPGLRIQTDSGIYHADPAVGLLSIMASGASFSGVANPDYDYKTSSKAIPKADKLFLDRVTSLGKEAGIEWFDSFKEMGGCYRARRSHEGFEMSFDNGSPQTILTPNGEYTFGSSCGGGNSTQRFHELLRRDFDVETVVPQKSYVPSHSITGPLLRFTPKQPLK